MKIVFKNSIYSPLQETMWARRRNGIHTAPGANDRNKSKLETYIGERRLADR
jgi:hypothetical protein